jgi:hypothetical protein
MIMIKRAECISLRHIIETRSSHFGYASVKCVKQRDEI